MASLLSSGAPGILVVGSNSFLAREFIARNSDLSPRVAGHGDILRDDLYEGIGCAINFAFAPALYESEYDALIDVDNAVARRARDRAAHYVMISSRRVYAESVQWNASEKAEARGKDIYGRNKARIENDLFEILGDRLTVLRPGNVVGLEATPGRQRVGAYLQNQLLREGRIRLTVASRTRRDLVPIDFFCRALRQVVLRRLPGVFNIGAGAATSIGDAARWLIEGFGSGELIEDGTDAVDEFQLDVSKLEQAFGLSCGPDELRECLHDSGDRLARQRARPLD